jgi:L-alanine-DL-glutamate epimerase-like enolase superfamily enzyme
VKITRILEKDVSIASPIRNAYIDFSRMTVSCAVVESDVLRDGRPLRGYGFNSNGRYAQGGILRERLIPRLLGAPAETLLTDDGSNVDPFRCWKTMMANEKPGGHGERSVAVGVLDMALWDLVAKIEGKPLYLLLAERYRGGEAEPEVWLYAAGGYYYPGKDVFALQQEIQEYLDLGFDTVKIKIGGEDLGDDLRRVEAVLDLVGDGARLAVDANARFDLDTALRYAQALAPYKLKWYEEPVEVLDFDALSAVSANTRTPLATGENLFSMPDARNLVRYGGMKPERDYLQFDPVLSYGLVEYLRTLDMLEENGWSRRRCIPHGGHQFATHIAAGLGLGGNESYPRVFEPFGGLGDDVKVRNGRIRLPDAPGIGIELNSALCDIFRSIAA